SKGFKRRVGLAQAILHDPDVLFLDEPTDGLDPNQKYQVRTLITDMAKEKAIVVSTHILEEVDAVCSRAVIIDRGRIVADSTSEELKRKLPNYNAVAIRVTAGDVDKTTKALDALEAVDTVETVSTGERVSQLRAVPLNGKSIAADVAECLTGNAVHPEELYVEKGSLDDVFRQITTSDTGDAHA
ncbi:MAG: ABC transporter ATP-binding protein, partial [Hyphomicrobiales bacterium]